MKRSEALAPLSRDHHQALALTLRLRRGADPAADRDAFLDFFRGESEAHFRIEEEVLLPFAADVLPASDPDVVQLLDEHAELRRRAAAIAAAPAPDAEALRAAGALLARHVRHEERVVFPRIEERLGAERLRELGALIEAAEGPAG